MRAIFILLISFFFNINSFGQENEEYKVQNPECKQEITGFVKNIKTAEVLPKALVQLFNRGELVTTIETGSDGAFRFTLECGTRYSINARFENYTINSKIIYTTTKVENKELDLFLYPTREFVIRNTNKYIDTNFIDFETDVENISEPARLELEKVVNIMRKYPEKKFSVDVHTDSKGDSPYSLSITKQRADEIVNYLVEKGIEADRLEANGYGDTQLVNHCAKDIKCSEAEHKANRRIEFLVIE
jgi:outer membrane protein OmpA-like peptidoglycan-associated protein